MTATVRPNEPASTTDSVSTTAPVIPADQAPSGTPA
jgi:hypothetical protein